MLQRPFRLPPSNLSCHARGNGKIFKQNLGTIANLKFIVTGRVTAKHVRSSGHLKIWRICVCRVVGRDEQFNVFKGDGNI